MNNSSEFLATNITEEAKVAGPKSGYDLPVYGLDNGLFYYLHVPALLCIISSFCCVIIVLVLSFRHKSYRKFFSWTKSERFIVYIAICDGCFNLFHGTDHVQYIITEEHVRPVELCELYAFVLTEFMTAQNLIVNLVAVNAFMLMYWHINLNFGKKDWRLLVWTFGAPFVVSCVAAVTGMFGPCGSFCHFDPIKGGQYYIYFTTIPLVIIIVVNSILYGLTWRRIKQETSHLAHTENLHTVNKSKRAAKTMTMFIVAFFIQWWALTVFSLWILVTPNFPPAILHIVTIFTNLGGCLNLGVYIIMRRRSTTSADDHSGESKKVSKHSSHEMKSKSSGFISGTQYSDVSTSNTNSVFHKI